VVLIVEDNGKGFNLRTAVGPNDRGIGLINMRERASFVGGTLEIESKVGVGTTIFVRVPISRS
ncbi:MAG TPA: ATP-binding protein, partial [Pyrinomonadaceae bacterium]|nr:ATP-binding protein [Pyrinomonadaceae bacterium]